MHRIDWHGEDSQRISWLVPDGVVPFDGAVAERLGATAVVALGTQALLICRERAEPLTPRRAVPRAGGALTWQPLSTPPLTLGDEPTAHTPGDAAATPLTLIPPDGSAVPIDEELLLIGRHPACRVRPADPRVSTLHCALFRDGGAVRLVDLGSRNGTSVDGTRVHQALIERRVTLSLGGLRLLLTPTSACEVDEIPLPSGAIQAVNHLCDRVAPSGAPVFVHGESGVGKEGVARRLHRASGRRGRFVVLNAATLSSELAASQLFGHAAGAFTGAASAKEGAFVAADGGTLFLDEIAELDTTVQAELLRVVELGEVRPLGSTAVVRVDVRLITATHRDLSAMMAAGQFREDLYHRICVVPIVIPPLRQRPDDLEVLAREFLRRQSPPRALSAAAMRELRRHRWPGNIRELFNVLRRACLMRDDAVLDAVALEIPPPAAPSQRPTLDELLRGAVIDTYSATGNSVKETAKRLGVHRATVYRYLRGRRS